jgi:hypothetical protein
MRHHLRCVALLAVAIAVLSRGAAVGQEILLDKVIRAGPLLVFQDLKDPKTYYYVPDKAHVAVGEDGRPQFSFLKYVSNVESAPGAEGAGEGEGGGIVHCLVQLGVTPDQLDEARAELRRLVPGANIAGPVMFKSGKFGLVSSFKEEGGEWTTQVVGIGNAPILDGEKAAVSMRLTKLGAKILWQSFKTATPDISFSFEMEMPGYRSPYDAKLEADFDQVYKQRDFEAAAALGGSKVMLGFEIKDALDELRSSGAIKVTTKGENEALDKLVQTAYGKICDMIFDKMQTGAFAPETGGTDLLDKAGKFMKTEAPPRPSAPLTGWAVQQLIPRLTALGDLPKDESDKSDKSDKSEPGKDSGKTPDKTPGKEPGKDTGKTPDKTPGKDTGKTPGKDTGKTPDKTKDTSKEKESQLSLSMLASYKMKTTRRSGKFELSFNKYMTDTVYLRFDENIGNFTQYMNDPKHFLEVNIDDPVFKQREVSVILDGQNAADFAGYVNYVTVRLRKVHEGGDQTNDEIRIDRNNFSSEGNAFKLLYGWKNDKNREKWMSYDYDTVWSFQGGKEVDLGWRKSTNFAITVVPPYLKRTVHLEADPDTIQNAEVRLITVKLYHDLEGTEQIKQATLNPAQGKLSESIEYICPPDQNDYEYEISWRLKGGKTVTSGRQKGSDDFLFCDELPN